MSQIKGINFLDIQDKFKEFNNYKGEDIFETHDDEQINEFITGLLIQKMKNELILDKVRELISEYKIMTQYKPEDYQKTLQEINELLEMVNK